MVPTLPGRSWTGSTQRAYAWCHRHFLAQCRSFWTGPGSNAVFICGSSVPPPSAFPLPAAGASLPTQPAPGLGPALIPFPEAAQPLGPGYSGYQPHSGQDLGYSTQPQEPMPAATTAPSYQVSATCLCPARPFLENTVGDRSPLLMPPPLPIEGMENGLLLAGPSRC